MLSIVTPIYNEEESIIKVVEELIAVMNKSNYKYEIVLVNDGSTDRTEEKIKSLNYSEIKYVAHERQKGYGSTLKSGIAKTQYEIIAITDADGTYPNEKIPEMAKKVIENSCDMCVGARTKINCQIPLIRKPAKWLLKKLAEYLTERKIPDLNSGLRVFRKDAYKKFKRILPNGFSFTTTITIAMLKNNYKVIFLPINYSKRTGHSKIQPIKDTINFFTLIIKTVMYYDPLKVFVPASLFLFGAAFFVFTYSLCFMERLLDTTTILLFVTGLQILAIGMLADLIDKRRQ